MKVIVIGGGPGGLATLKTLLHSPESIGKKFDPVLIELSNKIGGTFDQRNYEDGALVSSKQLTCFSDHRYPLEANDHPTMLEYVEYLNSYVKRFELDGKAGEEWKGTEFEGQSRIKLESKVIKISKGEKGGHMVTYQSSTGIFTTLHCDAVAICTGLHVTPAVPAIIGMPDNLVAQNNPISTLPGLPTVPTGENWTVKEGIRVIHSSQYKKREEFKDRKVMILGVGETSMDLSYFAITSGAKEVVVCHRGGFLSFPKVLNDFKVFGFKFEGNLPIDGLITNLFETTYVHPFVANIRLRWHVSDFVIKRVLYFLTGTQAGCSQWVGGLPPSRLGRAYVFLNKSSRAMPWINRPYKPSSTFLSSVLGTEYLDTEEASKCDKSIDLALWPSHVDETGRVHFLTSKELPQGDGIRRIEEERMRDRIVRPDLIIYCTGYKQDFSFLDSSYSYRSPSEVDTREICHSQEPTLGFIGFIRPTVGALPIMSELQAMWWVLALAGKMDFNVEPPHYKLLSSKTARIQYGVDYSAYMSTLAKDMKAAPGLWELYSEYGLHVLVCYCFGAAFISFYRLTGPFKSAEMIPIVKGELWETICRRGLLGNIFMGLIPMIFYGLLNGIALLIESVWTFIFAPILNGVGLVKSSSSSKGVVLN